MTTAVALPEHVVVGKQGASVARSFTLEDSRNSPRVRCLFVEATSTSQSERACVYRSLCRGFHHPLCRVPFFGWHRSTGWIVLFVPDGRNLVQKGIYCQPSPVFENLYDLPIQASLFSKSRRKVYTANGPRCSKTCTTSPSRKMYEFLVLVKRSVFIPTYTKASGRSLLPLRILAVSASHGYCASKPC